MIVWEKPKRYSITSVCGRWGISKALNVPKPYGLWEYPKFKYLPSILHGHFESADLAKAALTALIQAEGVTQTQSPADMTTQSGV